MSAFECDSQFLAYFAGSTSFVLFVVEAFVCLVLPHIWSLLLAGFAFVFYLVFGRLAASARFAVFAVSVSALVIFLFFLALLLFAPESLSTEKVLSS